MSSIGSYDNCLMNTCYPGCENERSLYLKIQPKKETIDFNQSTMTKRNHEYEKNFAKSPSFGTPPHHNDSLSTGAGKKSASPNKLKCQTSTSSPSRLPTNRSFSPQHNKAKSRFELFPFGYCQVRDSIIGLLLFYIFFSSINDFQAPVPVELQKRNESTAEVNIRSSKSTAEAFISSITKKITDDSATRDNNMIEGMQTSDFVDNGKIQDNGDITETIDVMYDDLKYRRVCTSVGASSVLCMTIRYPFDVALQQSADPSTRYPSPVEPKFYDLPRDNVFVIQQKEWFQCNNNDTSLVISDDTMIQDCMTKKSIEMKQSKGSDYVIVLWSRRQLQLNRTVFHGTGHKEAILRIYSFFGNDHEIIVTGASPSPIVTENMRWLFGSCFLTNVHRKPNYNCDYEYNFSNYVKPSDTLLSFTDLEEGHLNVANFDYRLKTGENQQRILENVTALQSILEKVKRKPGWNSLRNMSLIVEYPFAHIQTQDLFLSNPSQLHSTVQAYQNVLPSYYMQFKSIHGRKQLSQLNGFNFQHLIVFDGLPQFYPTVTNGWTYHLYDVSKANITSPDKFTYTGWKPEYGRSCVGPLPSNSLLREVNLMARESFKRMGHDMKRWYGRTWEFANLFWFQMKMFSGLKGLDCTHSIAYGDGISSVHKYFVQAMIDDYFENQ